MVSAIRHTWQQLKRAEPGHRFQEYNREHNAKRRSNASKVLSLTVGVIILLVGIVGLPAPGPGMIVIAIGAALIARESWTFARAMDWIELRLRAILAGLKSAWRRASVIERVAVCFLAAVATGAAAVLVYRVAFKA